MDLLTSRWNEKGAFEDEGNRMKTRPVTASGSRDKGLRRKGQAVEDLGSGFVKKGAAGKSRRGVSPKGNQGSNILDPSASPDEIDLISQPETSDVPSEEEMVMGPDGQMHETHRNFRVSQTRVLKKLKFTKNKAPQDGAPASQRSGASSSALPVLQENANLQRPIAVSKPKSVAKPQRTASQTSVTRPLSPPSRPRHRVSPDPSTKTSAARTTKPQEIPASENARPKPRPIGKPRVVSGQLQPAPFPTLDPPPGRKNTVSTREKDAIRTTKETLAPAPFPMAFPVASLPLPAKFPTLPALGSQEPQWKGKALAPRSSAKQPVPRTEPSRAAEATRTKGLDNYPVPSPLSSQTKTTGSSRKSSRATKKPVNRTDSSEEESEVETNDVLKPQPFPMNTQVFSSIGFPCTPPVAGPSRSGKRSSSDMNNSGSDRQNKKTRKDDDITLFPLDDYNYEEDDTVCMSPTRDPRTLCPYCDAPMPRSPTPLLTRLLASTALKSKPQARPGNPMGRKAPFTIFIAVCQRHRFETKILPEAEAKGWPKSIEWTKLERRVTRMKNILQELIQDPVSESDPGEDEFLNNEEPRGSKARCIFWKEVINEVKQKGTRAVAGVQGQFANFEKTQPGYYGERGSVIIHQTLYDLFPPTSIDPNHVTPLTPNEFIQRILVPEVGVRLIMEDKKLVGNQGLKSAVQILRDSANYGVAMFPEDGGEWGGGEGAHSSDDEPDIAELMVMERARKRRKELEKEDEREEEELRLLQEDEEQSRKYLKKKEKEKANKGKGKDPGTHYNHAAAPPPAPRPKPRPLGKSSSGINTLADEINGLGSSQAKVLVDGTTDDENEGDFQFRSKRSFHSSPTGGESSTRRVTRSVSRSASVDVDLCSSSENTGHSDASLRQPRSAKKKRNGAPRKANRYNKRSDGSDSDPVIVNSRPSPQTTPIAKRLNHDRQVDADMEDTPMPPSHIRFSPTPPEGQPNAKIYPLQLAKERKARYVRDTIDHNPRTSNQAGWLTSMRDEAQESPVTTHSTSPNSDSWLLSD